MEKEIIDLRLLGIEELEELPMYKWTELLWQRREAVRKQLRLIQRASEFLENATAQSLRMRALRYKRVVEERVKKDKEVRHWIRESNQSEESKEKEKMTTSKEEEESTGRKEKEKI